jgi:hypothetical protein
MFGQVIWTESFEGTLGAFPPAGWSLGPAPATSPPAWNNWQHFDTARTGTRSAVSFSYDNDTFAPITPDNWLITRPTTVEAGKAYVFSFWARSAHASYGAERFAAYATTAADPTIPVGANNDTSTNPFLNAATGSVMVASRLPLTPVTTWNQYSGTFTATENGVVHFAIRHFNCSDQFWLAIDDVMVEVRLPYMVSMTNFIVPSHYPTGKTGYQATSVSVQNRGTANFNRSHVVFNFYALNADGTPFDGDSTSFLTIDGTAVAMNVGSVASTQNITNLESTFLALIDEALGPDVNGSNDGVYKIRAEARFTDASGHPNPEVFFPSNIIEKNIRVHRNVGDFFFAGHNTNGTTHTNSSLIPFTYQGNNITQIIYRKQDLEAPLSDASTTFGLIHGITFIFANPGVAIPDNDNSNHLWIANVPADGGGTFTSLTDWRSPQIFTKVASAFTLKGTGDLGTLNEVYVDFATPFEYTGGGLIFMTQRASLINYTSGSTFRVGSTTNGQLTNSVINGSWLSAVLPNIVNEQTDTGITIPTGISTTRQANRPIFRFMFEPKEIEDLTDGLVRCSVTLDPIAGAQVSIQGSLRLPVFSDEFGSFEIQSVVTDATLSAIARGFYSGTVDLQPSWWTGSSQETQAVIEMQPLPEPVEIIVTLGANDLAGGVNLVGATVTLDNPSNLYFEIATDDAGEYTFDEVFPHHTYTLRITATGYIDQIHAIVVPENQSVNILLDYEMIEAELPPLGVFALADEDDEVAIISWYSPYVDEIVLTHNTSAFGGSVGASPTPFQIAHRYTPAMLTAAGITAGQSLYRVSFIPNEVNASYMLQLFTPNPSTNPHPYPLLPETPDYSQMFDSSVLTSANIGIFHDMYLIEPFPIPTDRELWIVFYIFDYTGFPAGREIAPQDSDTEHFGDLTKIGTGNWQTLNQAMGATVFPFNWAISAYAIDYEFPDDQAAMRNLRRLAITNAAMENFYPPEFSSRNVQVSSVAYEGENVILPRSARVRNASRAIFDMYKVYRVPANTSAFTDADLIFASQEGVPSSDLYIWITDEDWGTRPVNSQFRYAVTTLYVPADTTGIPFSEVFGNARESEPMFSNVITRGAEGLDITINVVLDGYSATGSQGITAELTRVANSMPAPLLETFGINQPSVTFNGIRANAVYKLFIDKPGFGSYESTFLWTSNSTVNVVLQRIDVIFHEDFETPSFDIPETWTRWTNSKWAALPDTSMWKLGEPGTRAAGRRNSRSAFSESFCVDTNVCVYPENWLITPAITIPDEFDPEAGSYKIMLEFSYAPGSPTRPTDKLFVYISSADAPLGPTDFVGNVMITNQTSTAGETIQHGVSLIAEIVPVAGDFSWTLHTVDISEFVNLEDDEDLYIAFRHSKSVDQFILRLDDIKVYAKSITPVSVAGIVREDTTEGPFVGTANIAISSADPTFTTINLVSSAADGTFATASAALPTFTEYTFTVTKPGYFDAVIPYFVGDEDITGLMLPLQRHGTISGTVVDTLDAGINLVNVKLHRGATLVGEMNTTSNGQFSFTTLAREADYTLTLYKTDIGTKTISDIDLTTNHTAAQGNILFVASISEVEVVIPAITALTGNYPNPFNPETTIAFDMSADSHVTIEIFNIRGQKVTTLVNDVREAGIHSVVWKGLDDSGRSVGSGIYFYRMTTDNYTSTQKMILMK